ncbi:MAG: DUF6596 domain-containing protein [Gaiellaceae bacterium]
MPDEAEAAGLLALMLLTHSRRDARFRGGELVLLDEQDRSLWDEAQIVDARQLLERALALRGAGAYDVQAAIADLHTQEPHDWEQIALLYRRLEELTGSAVVTVNRAVPLAEIEGPEAALALLTELALDGLPVTFTRPAPTSCGASAGTTRRAPPTPARTSSPRQNPNGVSCTPDQTLSSVRVKANAHRRSGSPPLIEWVVRGVTLRPCF